MSKPFVHPEVARVEPRQPAGAEVLDREALTVGVVRA